MRETVYRGLHRTNGWCRAMDINTLKGYGVDPDTISECTFKKQWCYQDPSVKDYIFEGDIVEVIGERYVPGEGQKSKYDGQYYIRAVVYYSIDQCAYCLDKKNEFNGYIMKCRGTERLERELSTYSKLGDYYTQGYWDKEEWQRHHNGRCHWGNIKVIGNIYQNPELLLMNPAAVKRPVYKTCS